MTYHAHVSEAGEIVLPADLARSLGLRPGDDIVVERDGSATGLRLLSSNADRSRVGDQVERFIAERASDWDE